ncbi:hypothetical protein [Streptomyces alkaliphilus]|uniref:hypothetical protein n=1 Tax=Streptomyces alkaliphilus TaxID=1472722 RepID=UPI00117E84E9|nr:hypothetical protein [Streptomyces alkaliphilus]MQS06928.1 hypothetical protein [Streptomyces alkaliphilus]
MREEIRLLADLRVVHVAAGLTVLWTLLLLVPSAQTARALGPHLLFLDTAGFGALFAVALILVERTERTDAVRRVSPLRPVEAVLCRILPLTLLTCAMAVPIALAVTRPAGPAEALRVGLGTPMAVAPVAALLLACCLAAGTRARTLPGVVMGALPFLVPLLVVPVAHLLGVLGHPLAHLVPTTAGARLIESSVTGAPPAGGVLPALLWAWIGAALAAVAATRALGAPPPHRTRFPRHSRIHRPRTVHRPRTERHPRRGAGGRITALLAPTGPFRDPLPWLAVAAPLLTALALRPLWPTVVETVADRYGIDLVPHTPTVFAALILLHVPVTVGTVIALRWVEDAEEGLPRLVRVAPVPAGLPLLLWLVAAWGFSLPVLTAAIPLSGLAPVPGTESLSAAFLAAPMAPLLVAVVAATATNRVEALVATKAAGALSVGVPVAAALLPAPAGAVMGLLPPAWPLLVLADTDGTVFPALAALAVRVPAPDAVAVPAGVLAALLLCVPPVRRALTRGPAA